MGLGAFLAALTYGIQPYGGHAMGWTNPWVLAGLIGGVVLLVGFCVVETRVADPMFHIEPVPASGRSAWATSPASWRPPAAAVCSSC